MTEPEQDEAPRSEPAFDTGAFDEEHVYTIHPALFGWIVLIFAFLAYHLAGGITAYVISGGEPLESVSSIRLLTMFSQVLFLLAPALVLVKMQPWTYRRLLRLRPAPASQLVLPVIAVAALQIPISTYIRFQEYALETWLLPREWLPMLDGFKESISEMYGTIATAHTPGELMFVLLVIAVTPAICEELLFRGIVFGSFRRGMRTGWAVALSGIMFGVFHMNPVTFVPLAGLGIFLAWITWQSGSILPAIAAHVTNNTIAIISLYFLQGVDPALTTEGSSLPGPELAFASFLSIAVFFAIMAMFRKATRPGS